MNNKIPHEKRVAFREWFRAQLRDFDPPFYQRRGDHYLIREFAKYTVEQQHSIDEASLGRYLRDEQPVVPTPERCRDLAAVLNISYLEVMMRAGYITTDDLQEPRKQQP